MEDLDTSQPEYEIWSARLYDKTRDTTGFDAEVSVTIRELLQEGDVEEAIERYHNQLESI